MWIIIRKIMWMLGATKRQKPLWKCKICQFRDGGGGGGGGVCLQSLLRWLLKKLYSGPPTWISYFFLAKSGPSPSYVRKSNASSPQTPPSKGMIMLRFTNTPKLFIRRECRKIQPNQRSQMRMRIAMHMLVRKRKTCIKELPKS